MSETKTELLIKIAEIYVSIGHSREKLEESADHFKKLMLSVEKWNITMKESELQLSKYEKAVAKLFEQLNNLEEENESTGNI